MTTFLPTNQKALNLGLILTSLFAYLEWGGDNSMFLFQGECDVIGKAFTNPASVLHPFIVLPMVGQMLLVITLFQKNPNMVLTLLGMSCIGLLLFFVFIIGVIGLYYRIILCAVPFVATAVFVVRNYWVHRS